MEKKLPPVPIKDMTPNKAPPPLREREYQKYERSPLLKVEQLGRQLATFQAQLDEREKRINELTSLNYQYVKQMRQQEAAVFNLADAIGKAFGEYQRIIQKQNLGGKAEARPESFETCFAEILSAWSDTPSP